MRTPNPALECHTSYKRDKRIPKKYEATNSKIEVRDFFNVCYATLYAIFTMKNKISFVFVIFNVLYATKF